MVILSRQTGKFLVPVRDSVSKNKVGISQVVLWTSHVPTTMHVQTHIHTHTLTCTHRERQRSRETETERDAEAER